MGKKLCGRKIVKVYNYAKDLGMRVEAHGVRIAFGGKGGVTMNSGLCASLTRILAELAKIMHGFLTHLPPITKKVMKFGATTPPTQTASGLHS